MSEWQPVIGLEVHAQLSTRSKLFSGAATAVGAEPNVNACAVDLGLPGVLPVLNEAALDMAIRFGLAIGARVSRNSVFARKNYFYPDLPKGYQISQYERPIVEGGAISLIEAPGVHREVAITRAHLEEDAGKSLHGQFADLTAIDLNRAGTPLLEIVSEPQMHSAADAILYLRAVHQLVRYLDICDGNMQDGSFRCDANVSVRRGARAPFGVRTEIKNLNSFRFIEKAINFEIERQVDLLSRGHAVRQETRLYDPDRDETRPMRSKEDAEDYRYFPDPDLLPIVVDEERLSRAASELPELPEPRLRRFLAEYAMSGEDAVALTSSRSLADYYEAVTAASGGEVRLACNWVLTELAGALNRDSRDIGACPVPPARLGTLLRRIADGTISGKIAKDVFDRMWREGGEPDEIIAREGLRQVTDADYIRAIAMQVLESYPKQLEQYRSGKTKLLGFFVGQALKRSEGKANPQQLNEMLLEVLGEDAD